MATDVPKRRDGEVASIFIKLGDIELGPAGMPLRINVFPQSEIEARIAHLQETAEQMNRAILGEGRMECLTVVDFDGGTHEIKFPVTIEQIQGLSDTISAHLKNLVLVLPRRPAEIEKLLEGQEND